MAIKRNLNVGFESIEDGEVEVNSTVTDGMDVGDVVESNDGGQEVAAIDNDIQKVTDGIVDMLAVDEGLGEEETQYAEQIETNPTEVTGDTVVAAMESLSAAIAISGVDFTKSSIGFESIAANPAQALSASLEDYKDFFKRLWVQIKEFFKKLMLGFKKIFTAVMKWTAADVDACDKLIKKIKEGGEIAAISQKDGTIFKSTKTKVQKTLGGYLAALDHKDLSGNAFVSTINAVLASANNTKPFTDAIKISETISKGDKANLFGGTNMGVASPKYSNFSELPSGYIAQAAFVSGNSINVMCVGDNVSDLSKYGEVKKLTAKSDFISGIKVENIGANELVKVLTALKSNVQNNKKYFDAANKSIEATEKVVEGMLKASEGSDESLVKWAKVGAKIGMRVAKSGIYDSVLTQIRTNKAVLSVCKTVATGKADKEEK